MLQTSVLVGEAVAGETAQVRHKLEELINSTNKSAFDIGELASKVKQSGDYAGYTTFKDYSKTLAIKPQKLRYLMTIADVFAAVGIKREKYEPLGISRCRAITSLDPYATWKNPQTGEETPMSEFISEFVEKGADMSLEEIQQHVRTLKGITGEDDIVWVNLPFKRLVVDTTLKTGFELARKNIGTVSVDDEGIAQEASNSKCVEVWAADYITNPANSMEQV